ncbi:hypothetical protein ACHAPD_003945 [Fusarium lateritium]
MAGYFGVALIPVPNAMWWFHGGKSSTDATTARALLEGDSAVLAIGSAQLSVPQVSLASPTEGDSGFKSDVVAMILAEAVLAAIAARKTVSAE